MDFDKKERQYKPRVRTGSKIRPAFRHRNYTDWWKGVRELRGQKEDFIKFLFKTHRLDYILLKDDFQKEVKS